MACEAGRDREQPQAKGFRFPATCVVVGQGEGLHPGEQVQGKRHDREPDPVLVVAVERKIAHAGVFGVADAVLTPCPLPVS